MAESENNFRSECLRELDCSVCMDRLNDPKVLSCQHSYCKPCLDNLIQFQPDGSGTITCPLRCNIDGTVRETLIPADKTTNDLPVPYQLKSILDLFDKQQQQQQQQQQRQSSIDDSQPIICEGDCSNNATVCCIACKIFFCSSCKRCNDISHSKCSVSTNRETGQVSLMCSEHKTLCEYYCCDQIICVYCKHREHSLHAGIETVTEHAARLKQFLLSPQGNQSIAYSSESSGMIQDAMDVSTSNMDKVRTDALEVRKMLQQTLRRRQVKCLIDHLRLLQREEERIVKEYEERIKEQLQHFSTATCSGILSSSPLKQDVEILLKKDDITTQASIFSKVVPLLSVSLTDSILLQPLGDLSVVYDTFVPIIEPISSESISFCCPIEGKDDAEVRMNEDALRRLLQDVLHVDTMEYMALHGTGAKPSEDSESLSDTTNSMTGIITTTEDNSNGDQNNDDKNNKNNNNNNVSASSALSQSLVASMSSSTLAFSSTSSSISPSISSGSSSTQPPVPPPPPSYDNIEKIDSIKKELEKGQGVDSIRSMCKEGNEDLILMLLDHHPSVAAMKNKMGNTLLHLAAAFGCSKVLARLLQMDSGTINTVNLLGSTPLHYATEGCQVKCVEALLKVPGCRVDLVSMSGYTAPALAEKLNYIDIMDLFRQYGSEML